MLMLTEIIGKPAVLEQLAEECAELGKAALKMARFLRGENPVYTDAEKIKSNLEEEIADVDICIGEILQSKIASYNEYAKWAVFKMERMEERMKAEEKIRREKKNERG